MHQPPTLLETRRENVQKIAIVADAIEIDLHKGPPGVVDLASDRRMGKDLAKAAATSLRRSRYEPVVMSVTSVGASLAGSTETYKVIDSPDDRDAKVLPVRRAPLYVRPASDQADPGAILDKLYPDLWALGESSASIPIITAATQLPEAAGADALLVISFVWSRHETGGAALFKAIAIAAPGALLGMSAGLNIVPVAVTFPPGANLLIALIDARSGELLWQSRQYSLMAFGDADVVEKAENMLTDIYPKPKKAR